MPDPLPKGVGFRRNKGGIPVLSIHYSADPDRDPAGGKLHLDPVDGKMKLWVDIERPKYSSQGAWDREQEMHATAGGGELVFSYVLRQYWDKIVITDPNWMPDPKWVSIPGFDHGKTNPTAGLTVRADYDGVLYACGEYYLPSTGVETAVNLPLIPGMDIGPQQHAAYLRGLPGFWEAEAVMADPSIFIKNQAQKNGTFRAIADLYGDAGLHTLQPARNDELAGIERILDHWRDLDHREPTLKIVCRIGHDRRQHGLFPHDCPNLIWELLRTMREQLTPVQLMRRNPSEKIVDKDNHLRDTLKYIVLALPEPTRKSKADRITEAVKGMDSLNAAIKGFEEQQKIEKEEEGPGITMGGGIAARRGWQPTRGGMRPPLSAPFRRPR